MSKDTWGVRLRAVGAAAACSLALVACGGGDQADKDADRTEEPDVESARPDDGLDDLLGVPQPDRDPESETGAPEILDHGDDERVLLELDLEEGQESTSTMRMTMTMDSPGVEIPTVPMTMVVAAEVLEVTDDRITIRSTFEDVSVDEAGLPPGLVTELETAMAPLEGLAITADQAPSGAVLDTRFSLADNAPPSAHQMVEQIAGSMSSYNVAFPPEALGEGASWRVVDEVDSGGLTMSQTTTYVLEDLDDDGYRITSQADGTFEPMSVDGVRLVRGTVVFSGDSSGALDLPMPTLGHSEGTTTMVMKVAGRTITMVTDVEMEISSEGN